MLSFDRGSLVCRGRENLSIPVGFYAQVKEGDEVSVKFEGADERERGTVEKIFPVHGSAYPRDGESLVH